MSKFDEKPKAKSEKRKGGWRQDQLRSGSARKTSYPEKMPKTAESRPSCHVTMPCMRCQKVDKSSTQKVLIDLLQLNPALMLILIWIWIWI